MTEAARTHNVSRSDLITKLEDWNADGLLKGFQRHEEKHRYLILKELPTDPQQIASVADRVSVLLNETTQKDLDRVRRLFDWATSSECLPKALSRYFGDVDSLPDETVCGKCTVCRHHAPVVIPPAAKYRFDDVAFQSVLKAAPPEWRFDAKLLARIAFGVKSPFITERNLHKHRTFGTMADHPWDVVLQRFQEVVDQNPNSPPTYRPPTPEPAASPRTPKKRKIEEDPPEASGSSSPKKPKTPKKKTVQSNKIFGYLRAPSDEIQEVE